eukprot:1261328-Pleurochrysis_carterae.AAC.1
MDRKMMNAILETMTSQAARRSYAESCAGSGRELLRLLASEAAATSTATSATLSALLHAHDVKGISQPTVQELNSFIHQLLRLNRALPLSARLPDSVLAEKVANATRRLGDGISTVLD